MNNIEIILVNVSNEYIDLIINEELKINPAKIVHSHFYDKVNHKDIKHSEIECLSKYYSASNTGNIFCREIFLGCFIRDVFTCN